LQRLDYLGNRKKSREDGNQEDSYYQPPNLPVKRVTDLGHPGILPVSYASRKFRQLCRRFVVAQSRQPMLLLD
jgi:hypothetical protein